LIARGQTVIENAHYIFRGYEDIEQKLTGLGVKIIS
jgi:UDP-N-acetylglucosamine enolpyruvyl transferase